MLGTPMETGRNSPTRDQETVSHPRNRNGPVFFFHFVRSSFVNDPFRSFFNGLIKLILFVFSLNDLSLKSLVTKVKKYRFLSFNETSVLKVRSSYFKLLVFFRSFLKTIVFPFLNDPSHSTIVHDKFHSLPKLLFVHINEAHLYPGMSPLKTPI